MNICTPDEYMQSIQRLLRDYDSKYYDSNFLYWKIIDNHTYLIFKSFNILYFITCNKSCMFVGYYDNLIKGNFSTIHNVPLMLSSTDTFMFSFLKLSILKPKNLTLFDFVV